MRHIKLILFVLLLLLMANGHLSAQQAEDEKKE